MVEYDGEQQDFKVQIYLDDLDSEAIRVELHADGANGESLLRQEICGLWPIHG
ncbi:MAG: hypothetical protein ABI856_18080 [Nitrospira sp.]